MKLRCPCCRASFSLDVLLVAAMVEDEAREAILASLEVPNRFSRLIVEYIALFRPAKTALAFSRVASLLRELQPMIDEARVTRGGIPYPAPQDYWAMAFEEMLTVRRPTLTLPLKSHGYLIEVICGYSRKDAAKAEAQTEAKRSGVTTVGTIAAHQPAKLPPREPPKPMSEDVKARFIEIKRGLQTRD